MTSINDNSSKNYEMIKLQYGENVAKLLDNADNKADNMIEDKNLSIFKLALASYEENATNNDSSKFSNIFYNNLPDWAKNAAEMAFKVIKHAASDIMASAKLNRTEITYEKAIKEAKDMLESNANIFYFETNMPNSNNCPDKEISKNTTSFDEAYKEMRANVPDQTNTIKEKEEAISYIEKMLNSNDITEDNKVYWEAKKETIKMEINNIKNEEINKEVNPNKEEMVSDVWNEFDEFIKNNFKNNELPENLPLESKKENRVTYYTTYISYCERLIKCADANPEQRAQWREMIENAKFDKQNWENMKEE